MERDRKVVCRDFLLAVLFSKKIEELHANFGLFCWVILLNLKLYLACLQFKSIFSR